MMTDDELYRFFYPDKFKPKNSYVQNKHEKKGSPLICEKCKKEGVKTLLLSYK